MPAESVGCDAWHAVEARPKCRSRSRAARYSSWRMNTRAIVRTNPAPERLAQARCVRARRMADLARGMNAVGLCDLDVREPATYCATSARVASSMAGYTLHVRLCA